MTDSWSTCLVAALCLHCACFTPVDVPQGRVPLADRDRPAPTRPRPTQHEPTATLALQMGAGYWPGLGNLQPDGSLLPPDELGQFDDWGFSLDMVFDAAVAEFGSAHLNLGFDVGLMSFENKQSFDVFVVPPGSVHEGRVDADLIYITPSARMMIPVNSNLRAYYGLGLGYYLVSLQDRTSFYHGQDEVLADDGALGGFVAIGIDYFFGDGNIGLRVEGKLHQADFDRITGFSNDLDGLINTIELGAVLVF